MGKEVVAEHDDGNVHQIVGYEDSGKCALRILTEANHLAVGVGLAFL